MLNVLVIFSNPPGTDHLRLDREDKAISKLARENADRVEVTRLHASEIDDIHELLIGGGFDIVQFSGHGSPDGIILDKTDMVESGHLFRPEQLRSLLAIADNPPGIAVLLACYSNDAIDTLAEIAPFVVSALGPVDDESCLQFIRAFYGGIFKRGSVGKSFDNAVNLLRSKKLSHSSFRLDRRQLIRRGNSSFIEFNPDWREDSILVNLDSVASQLEDFGMTKEQLCHLIAKKLRIHSWIFAVPRERCVIPVGTPMFGEFSWRDKTDVVYCHKLMRISSDVPIEHWKLWNSLLISYNDLASSTHRILVDPASPKSRRLLAEATTTYRYNLDRYLQPACAEIREMGFAHLVLSAENAMTHCAFAEDYLDLERYEQVVQSLEVCLTNYHEVVDGLQPPEASPD